MRFLRVSSYEERRAVVEKDAAPADDEVRGRVRSAERV
jgi:hypothetical protein